MLFANDTHKAVPLPDREGNLLHRLNAAGAGRGEDLVRIHMGIVPWPSRHAGDIFLVLVASSRDGLAFLPRTRECLRVVADVAELRGLFLSNLRLDSGF